MAGDETAFFRFDTNANAVATDIVGSMERIYQALNGGKLSAAGSNALSQDLQEFQAGFDRLEANVVTGAARIKEAMSQLGAGVITPSEFRQKYQEIGDRTLAGLRKTAADEVGLIPTSIANRLPIADIVTNMSRSAAETFAQAARTNRGLGGDAVKGIRFYARDFINEVMATANAPVDFGYAGQGRLQELRNQLRAENLVRQDLLGQHPETQATEKYLGLSDLTARLRNSNVGLASDGKTPTWIPTDTAQNLRETIAALNNAEAAAKRLGQAFDEDQQRARELAVAARLISEGGYAQQGRFLLGPDGEVLSKTKYGAAPGITNPLDEMQALQAIEKRQAAAVRAEELAQQRQGGVLDGFLARVHRGDSSVGFTIGSQIGSAASFTAAYGSLFAIQHVIRDTMSEFKDYQDSITDLSVATRGVDGVSQRWVNTLEEIARLSGSNAGEAADAAARGIRAFTQLGDPQSAIEYAGNQTATTATQMSIITGQTLPASTGDTLAISTAFGLAPDQLNQVSDAVANAKRTVGGDAAQISQGLSLIALSAQSAGYSLNEAAAVISLVQARTNESGQAIATRLTRVFQIVGGSTGKSLAADFADQLKQYGVTSDSSVKDQMEAYAKIYADPNTTVAQRDKITSALGGTANLRELLPLLTENQRLQVAYREAMTNTGQATDEVNRKTGNLVGTLLKITSDIKSLQVNLANSGLFDFVGIGIQTIEPILHGMTALVGMVNELTDSWDKGIPHISTYLGLLVDVAIAAKAVSVVRSRGVGSGLVSGALGTLGAGAGAGAGAGGAAAAAELAATRAALAARREEVAEIYAAAEARAVAEGRMDEAIAAAAARRAVVEGAASAEAGVAGAATAAGGIGARLLTAMTGPAALGTLAVGAAAALLYAIGKQQDADQSLREAKSTYHGLAKSDQRAADAGYTSTALYKSAADAAANAGELTKMHVPGQYADEINMMRKAAAERARGLEYLARQVEKEEALNNATDKYNVFGSKAIETTTQLANGLDAIARNGGTAITQLHAYSQALLTPAPDVHYGAGFTPGHFKAILDSSVMNAIPGASRGLSVYTEGLPGQVPDINSALDDSKTMAGQQYLANFPKSSDPDVVQAAINAAWDPVAMGKAVDAKLATMTVSKEHGLSQHQQRQLLKAALATLDLSDFAGQAEKLRHNIFQSALGQLQGPSNNRYAAQPYELLGLKAPKTPLTEQGLINEYYNSKTLSNQKIIDILNGVKGADGQPDLPSLLAMQQGALGAIPGSDDGTMRESMLKNNLKVLRVFKRKQEPGAPRIPMLEQAIDQAEHDWRDQAVQRIEDLRQAAESRATTQKSLQAIRIRFAKRAFRKAGGDRNLIESLMESMDRLTIRSVINSLQVEVDAAKSAYLHMVKTLGAIHQVTNKFASEIAALNGLPAAPDGNAQNQAALDALKHHYQTLQENLGTVKDVFNTTAAVPDAVAPDPSTSSGSGSKKKDPAAGSGESAAQKHADLVAAQAAARAARVGGGIAQAAAALTTARAQLAAAKKGTVDYYNALAALYQAQWDMKNAIEAYHSSLFQLKGDMTDPVEQARDDLRTAMEHLRNAVSKDDRAAARVDVRRSEYALEKAKWDQKLSDMQTAEQLGRISYQTYLRYLQNESDRMHKMHNKTRQQIDHMNEIDLALKDAMGEASGQFNLGDISTSGFIYQTRRWAAQHDPGKVASGGPYIHPTTNITNSHNTVTITGTDTHEVRKVLRELLGDAPPRHSTGSHRRV